MIFILPFGNIHETCMLKMQKYLGVIIVNNHAFFCELLVK